MTPQEIKLRKIAKFVNTMAKTDLELGPKR